MKAIAAILVCLVLCAGLGCARGLYSPERATEPYPVHLHAASAVDIQVFRDDTTIEIVNATPHSYYDVQLWINQRYMHHVEELRAGQRKRISLWNFYDERGEAINAGGFWRIYEPDPVRLVQIQVDEHSPLVGLIVIRERRMAEE